MIRPCVVVGIYMLRDDASELSRVFVLTLMQAIIFEVSKPALYGHAICPTTNPIYGLAHVTLGQALDEALGCIGRPSIGVHDGGCFPCPSKARFMHRTHP
jgi:hypothetical protein